MSVGVLLISPSEVAESGSSGNRLALIGTDLLLSSTEASVAASDVFFSFDVDLSSAFELTDDSAFCNDVLSDSSFNRAGTSDRALPDAALCTRGTSAAED